MPILDSLNDHQREAVLKTDGALLIIAGAGSGKTKTIAHRIAYLISQGIAPNKILAVTFTNKAAGEMRERVEMLLNKEKIHVNREYMPFLGTFHSLGVYILRHDGYRIGISKHFSILDEEDTRKIIRDLIQDFELNPESYPVPRIRNAISGFKNELIDTAAFARDADGSPYQQKLLALYTAYEAQLQKMKGLDFDDLLLKTVIVLQDHPEALAYWQDRWSYIHIDEYQDTNKAQYILSRLLAARHKNIAVVGDIDQAIYSWRGADWRNILQFENDWPNARLITLEENYRSTQLILEAANAVIVNNQERKEKNLRSERERGESIGLVLLEDERREALFIASYVEYLKTEGIKPGSIAVLFRTNAQSRAIEEAFLKKNIPYRLIAGVKFYERKEVKDVLAYLKYALNPDDVLSRKRILNTPPRGVGKVLALKYIGGIGLTQKEKDKIAIFESIVENIRKSIQTKKPSEVLTHVIRSASFEKYYKGNKSEEDRTENIKELLSVARKFDDPTFGGKPPEGIEKLLTEAALSTQETEIEDKDSQVILLTAHAAKGLEFDVVIIAGMEEGLFPHSLSETEPAIEEERRLFYVALTRARQKVMITLAGRRMLYGEVSFNDPSRFLSEIPSALIAGPDIKDLHDMQNKDNEYNEEEISIF
ncbi:MAG: UvrD-helicase domain-containing protein [Patescibacteria group bacterium]